MSDLPEIIPSPSIEVFFSRFDQTVWAEANGLAVEEKRDIEVPYLDQMQAVAVKLQEDLGWHLTAFATHWGYGSGNISITVLFH